MRALEAFNKVLVGILLFLVCIQASLLFVMKNMQDQAKVRLVENQTPLDIKCGDAPFSEENYWDPLARNYNTLKTCDGWDCDKSALTWRASEDSNPKNLHVISVKNAPPMRWNEQDAGGVVRVRVPASTKPQVLALSSQSMHEWRLTVDKKANLEKIIVATPTIVWIDGVPEKTKIEYLPKEKMCSYPYSWEEAHNPDNEFRLFVGALKKITGILPSSFQGALVGKDFVVPKPEELARREIASVVPESEVVSPAKSNVLWVRKEDRVVPQQAVVDEVQHEVAVVPDKTQAVAGAFIVRKYRLHVWNANKKAYELVPVPRTLNPIDDITAIAADKNVAGRVFIFNEGNGGEIYSFEQSKNQWSLLKSGVPWAVRSLHYSPEEKKLYGLASRGRNFTHVLVFAEADKTIAKKPLLASIPFDPVRWSWEVVRDRKSVV